MSGGQYLSSYISQQSAQRNQQQNTFSNQNHIQNNLPPKKPVNQAYKSSGIASTNATTSRSALMNTYHTNSDQHNMSRNSSYSNNGHNNSVGFGNNYIGYTQGGFNTQRQFGNGSFQQQQHQNSNEMVLGGRARELHHQNISQSRADTETINRFERTHGSELQMCMPKKPPIQFASTRNSISAAQSRGSSPFRGQVNQSPARNPNFGGTWDDMIQRTSDNQLSSTLKRGDYAISQRRKSERVQTYRIMDPKLQEVNVNERNNKVTGCSRQRIEKNYQNNFKIGDQNQAQLPPKNPTPAQKSRNQETQSSLIIGNSQQTILKDRALGANSIKNTSQVIKNMRDFRSSIDCLQGGASCTSGRNHNQNKENINPHISRGLATSVEREEMGMVKQERLRSAKTYDRSMIQMVPTTNTNITYQNQPKAQEYKAYEKGTKKFWDKTQEIKQSSSLQRAKPEHDTVPREFSKGRKPQEIRDAFRSQITFV